MIPVRAEDLTPGHPIPHALYTRGGRLLAHGGAVITPEIQEFLAAHAAAEFRFDTRAEPIGTRATDDPQPPALESAAADADQADWERRLMRTRAELRRSASALVSVARVRWERLPLSIEVGVDPVPIVRIPRRDADPVPSEDERELREVRTAGVSALRVALAAVLDGRSCRAADLFDLAETLVLALTQRPELYSIPAMGLPRPCDALSEHAYSTGAIALGIAARLGWPRGDVLGAAVAGFLADSGMGLVPYPVRRAGRPLTDIEHNSVRRHPEYSVALARSVTGLPEPIVLGIYQHQERGDGSGYPHGLRAPQIHDLAVVLAVADTFAGMTAPRAHRPALTPHAAMSELAHSASADRLNRTVVAALVDLFGLYPARSFVRLSSGHVAVVGAAASPPANDRPVVHVVQPTGSPVRFGRGLDLARIEPKSLRIVEAIRAPEGIEV